MISPDRHHDRGDLEILERNHSEGFDASVLIPPTDVSRRSFLRRNMLGAGSLALGATFGSFLGRAAHAQGPGGPGYGPLFPIVDPVTGLPLVRLPEGFRYMTIGRVGNPMRGGLPTPNFFDGSAAIPVGNNHVVLIRNHEYFPPATNQPAQTARRGAPIYDPRAEGGTTNTLFDLGNGVIRQVWQSLGGTSSNCAGGLTPWGSWLTCEETFQNPGSRGFTKSHGWVFEVPAVGYARPIPLSDMGRFSHEAIAIDPEDPAGIVYETEDTHTSGFYRFLPIMPGQLHMGGRLQMLRVPGRPNLDLRVFQQVDTTYPVDWVDIPDPAVTGTMSTYLQGRAQGGATFARLEGAWPDADGKIYFNATTGGGVNATNNTSNGFGQVWEYDPVNVRLRVVFQSSSRQELDNPDNITVSPRTGGLVLCEDGALQPQRLQFLSVDGRIAPFAANNLILGPTPDEDFTGIEWTGATFATASDGQQWLFASLQNPGHTFAITGPWERGGL